MTQIKNLYCLVIICILLSKVLSENNCKIKMSQSKINFTGDPSQLIYNEGAVNSKWDSSSSKLIESEKDNDIEYFYIFEQKFATHKNHDTIVK